MWPGQIEAIDRYWPFGELKDEHTQAPRPPKDMFIKENAQIWPLYATPYSAYLIEQFCSFMFYALDYDLAE